MPGACAVLAIGFWLLQVRPGMNAEAASASEVTLCTQHRPLMPPFWHAADECLPWCLRSVSNLSRTQHVVLHHFSGTDRVAQTPRSVCMVPACACWRTLCLHHNGGAACVRCHCHKRCACMGPSACSTRGTSRVSISPQCTCRGPTTLATPSGELFHTLCLLQGAQYLFDHYISPFLKHHAAKLDPVFASTNTVSSPCIRQCHGTVSKCKLQCGLHPWGLPHAAAGAAPSCRDGHI